MSSNDDTIHVKTYYINFPCNVIENNEDDGVDIHDNELIKTFYISARYRDEINQRNMIIAFYDKIQMKV